MLCAKEYLWTWWESSDHMHSVPVAKAWIKLYICNLMFSMWQVKWFIVTSEGFRETIFHKGWWRWWLFTQVWEMAKLTKKKKKKKVHCSRLPKYNSVRDKSGRAVFSHFDALGEIRIRNYIQYIYNLFFRHQFLVTFKLVVIVMTLICGNSGLCEFHKSEHFCSLLSVIPL